MSRVRIVNIDPLENWKHLRSELVWAYEGPVTAYRSCAYPPFPIVAWLLRKGSLTLRFGDRREIYRAHQWIFPPAKEGWQEFSSDADIISIRFVSEWNTGDPLFERAKTIGIAAEKLPHLTKAAKRLVKAVKRQCPDAADLLRYVPGTPERHFEFQYELYRWMLAYTQAMRALGLKPVSVGQIDDRVRKALDYIKINNHRRMPNERELSKFAGISITHLNRLFCQDLGKTPIEYWEEQRMQTARLALQESAKSVKSIAYDLGFSSLSHFSSWVRKKMGQSPREVRNAASQKKK